MDLPSTLEQTLIDQAKLARDRAYAPYSNFKVGAALLTEDEDIITGCNIENISLTPTICAERTAIFKAISQGKTNFKAIVVVTGDGTPTPPCGVCRQVMSEFVDNDFRVILATLGGKVQRYDYSTIMPIRFTPTSSIGKQDPWGGFRLFMLQEQIVSEDRLELIIVNMKDLNRFQKKIEEFITKYDFNENEGTQLIQLREKIYDVQSTGENLERKLTNTDMDVLIHFAKLLRIES